MEHRVDDVAERRCWWLERRALGRLLGGLALALVVALGLSAAASARQSPPTREGACAVCCTNALRQGAIEGPDVGWCIQACRLGTGGPAVDVVNGEPRTCTDIVDLSFPR